MNNKTRVTTTTIRQRKRDGTPITMLTAYDFPMAKMLDEAEIDMLLVGDSLGNVVLGYDSTLPVTMADMLHHAKAVCRGTRRAMVVVDMPFLSYQISPQEALRNAGRLVQEGGAQAVKLEGGVEVADAVKAIVAAGIPVVGHLGLTPQSIHALGGFRVQGKEEAAAQKILDDARLLAQCGVFALVLECVPAGLAKRITESIDIPTIGIGAGNDCDGQVLVTQDLLGLYDGFTPKFVKKYVNLHALAVDAVAAYRQEVTERSFPGAAHGFSMADDVLEKLY